MVLAAGGARRFGTQKLVAMLAGKPVVRWSVEHALAAGVEDIVVVLGHEREAVRTAVAGLPVRIVVNERWADGMGTSLAAGVAAVSDTATAALIVLGDQPGVPVHVIEELLAAHARDAGSIAVPVYRGERGNPVLFPRPRFAEVARSPGDRGARAVLERHPALVCEVRVDLPMPPDVDQAADLRSVRLPGD